MLCCGVILWCGFVVILWCGFVMLWLVVVLWFGFVVILRCVYTPKIIMLSVVILKRIKTCNV